MPNYQDGKIYTIRCRSDNKLIYVGSTVEKLSRRLTKHRANSKITPNTKLYSKVNGNWDDWYIELYEVYPCNNKEILLKREGEIIRQIGTLNKEIAGRTSKEYDQDNAEEIRLRKKIYYQDNIEKLTLRQKKCREEHGLVKNQEYQERNKEKIKEYQKEYRLKNKDKAKEYNKEYHLKKKSNLIIKEDE